MSGNAILLPCERIAWTCNNCGATKTLPLDILPKVKGACNCGENESQWEELEYFHIRRSNEYAEQRHKTLCREVVVLRKQVTELKEKYEGMDLNNDKEK